MASSDSTSGRERKRAGRRRDTSREHSAWGERLVAGVPARIMAPRLVFSACLVAIIAFGLLMVYSASSVEALKEQGSSTYYLVRQVMYVAAGGVLFLALAKLVPWDLFRPLSWPAWWVVLGLLLVVLVAGTGGEEWGASRWINLGFMTLQPSELAKPVIIAVAAKILCEYYEDLSIDTTTFLVLGLVCVGIPCGLILLQPDMGTTALIVATVFMMLYLSGLSRRAVVMAIVGAVIAGAVIIAIAPYRLTRFLSSIDPWSDPYDTGFQATIAIMAFASGGLTGRGIGGSTMKYNYLPEAQNDYIFAIVGEECGFIGALLFIVVFAIMIIAAFKIAQRSPTLYGQLLASGSAFILAAQALLNILGILNVIPMSGKPLPFVSSGGSSMLASLILAGLIFRVSIESNVSTAADRRRSEMRVMSEEDAVSSHLGRSTAGEVHVRRASADPGFRARGGRDLGGRPRGRTDATARSGSTGRASGFSVYDGGGAASSAAGRGPARRGSGGAYERIDLSDPGERMRRGAQRVRSDYRDAPSGPSRFGDAPGRYGQRTGRGNHDRR